MMTTTVIIDAVVVLILVGFTAYGAVRGMLKTLAGLVIMVVALIGAGMIASACSVPIARLAAPVIQEKIAEKVETAIAEEFGDLTALPEETAVSLEQLLEALGVDMDVRETLTRQTTETMEKTGAAVSAALIESLLRSCVYGVVFMLAFVLLTLVLRALAGAMGLVMKLPGLHGLNTLGGGILGLIEGVLLVFLLIWVARRLGVSFETEAFADAYILHIFTTNTPLSLLSSLQ